MDYTEATSKSLTLPDFLNKKSRHEKISMLTCYDSSFAQLIKRTPIDMVLVGDSLGNVMLGYKNTISVTLDDMIHHGGAVCRVLQGSHFTIIDMPFCSYTNRDEALKNAASIMQRTGCEAVKLEGGRVIADQVKALVDHGIPVVGHLGLTPQSVHQMGGYRVQGKTEKKSHQLREDALALQEAGAFCLVLEMIPAVLAKTVSESLSIPTIGIGAGPHCDGQVLVLQDMLGFDDRFNPKFLKKYANLSETIGEAVRQFDQEVKNGSFPGVEHSF